MISRQEHMIWIPNWDFFAWIDTDLNYFSTRHENLIYLAKWFLSLQNWKPYDYENFEKNGGNEGVGLDLKTKVSKYLLKKEK